MKLDRPLVALDLEVTHLDPNEGRIIEIGAIKIEDLDSIGHTAWCSRLNPGIDIPPGATQVHGITNEMLKDEPTFADVAQSLWYFLDGCDLTGYNIEAFDIPYLVEEFRRVKTSWPHPDTRVIDAYKILQLQELRTLEWTLSYYTGEKLEGAHAALADAKASLEVLRAQISKYSPADADALCNLQRDPSWVDKQGRFKTTPDGVCITFGKHSGKTLADLPRGYLSWMLNSEFADEVKLIVSEELARRNSATALGTRSN